MLATQDDSEIEFFVELNLKYFKKNNKNYFPSVQNLRNIVVSSLRDFMKNRMPRTYKPMKQHNCDWSQEKYYLRRYRNLRF